jgi:hypothetical protein
MIQSDLIQIKNNLVEQITLDIVEKKIDINDSTLAEKYNKYDLLQQIKEYLAFINK